MKTISLNLGLSKFVAASILLSTFECSASIISDEIFDNSNWSAMVVSSIGGATHSTQQELAGGNPDEYRFMLHDFSGAGHIRVFHEYLNASYNPSIQGAISTITYSEDRIIFNPFFSGAEIGSAAAIMQEGKVFIGPHAEYSNTSWDTLLQESLTMLDFIASDLTNPNFLETGSKITFGYFRSNTTGGFTPQTEHGIDNWSVSINPVPAPAAVWLFGSGLIVLLGIRKNKS